MSDPNKYQWLSELERATVNKQIQWYADFYDNGSETYKTLVGDMIITVLYNEFRDISIDIEHERFRRLDTKQHPSWHNKVWFCKDDAKIAKPLVDTIRSTGYISEPLWNLLSHELNKLGTVMVGENQFTLSALPIITHPGISFIPTEEVTPLIEQMCRDTEAGELKWFPLTPGIGVCYGVTECSKKTIYKGTEFGNYTRTIYDYKGEGKFHLDYGKRRGWVDNDLGLKLYEAIKGSLKGRKDEPRQI